MKNWGNWSSEALKQVLESARQEGKKTVVLNQEHTDHHNDQQVKRWLEEWGYPYEVELERTVVHLQQVAEPPYTLIDGQETHRKHPDTFEIPNAEEIADLKAGDHVKLGFTEPGKNVERMWVLLYDLKETHGFGTLANEPVFLERLSHGDPVTFEIRHILGILKD